MTWNTGASVAKLSYYALIRVFMLRRSACSVNESVRESQPEGERTLTGVAAFIPSFKAGD